MRDEHPEFIDDIVTEDNAKSNVPIGDASDNVSVPVTKSTKAKKTSPKAKAAKKVEDSVSLDNTSDLIEGVTTTVSEELNNEVPKTKEPKKKKVKAEAPIVSAETKPANEELYLDGRIPNDANTEFHRDLDDININDMDDASWGDSFDSAASDAKKSLSVISNDDINFFYQNSDNDSADKANSEPIPELVLLDENGNPITTVGVFPSTDLYGPKAKFRSKYKIRRKKPNTIKKAIYRGVPTIVLVVALAYLFNFVSPMLFGGAAAGVDSAVLDVKMHNEYFAGTEGTINLKKMFPGTSSFALKSDAGSASVSDTGKVTNITKNFSVSINGGDYVNEVMNFTMVAGGKNVDSYKNLHKFAHTPEAKIKAGKLNTPVVICTTNLSMMKNAKYSTIVLSNDLYGNGVKINASKLVYDNLNGDYEGKSAFQIPYLPGNREVLFRDIQVMGKLAEESDHIKTFTNYGQLLSYQGTEHTSDEKARSTTINSIFEKGHKVVHLNNAIVNMEGCIVRQASDTAISIGTFYNAASTLNIKNSVIADSLTGGILMYGYDNDIAASHDGPQTWNIVNIEGFLDIYNWKKTSDLAFLPDTEGKQLAAIINPFIASTVAPMESYKTMKVTLGTDQYLHFGIIKIFTARFGKNHSDVTGWDTQGYLTEKFPIPPIAEAIMKDIRIWGYFGNNNGDVPATQTLSEGIEKGLYDELRNGRVAA